MTEFDWEGTIEEDEVVSMLAKLLSILKSLEEKVDRLEKRLEAVDNSPLEDIDDPDPEDLGIGKDCFGNDNSSHTPLEEQIASLAETMMKDDEYN